MSATRSRKEEKSYMKYAARLAPTECELCQLKAGDPQFVSESGSFKVIRNIFPYSIWDGQGVMEHMLILPKQHIESLDSLSPDEALEYIKLITEYERQGYDVFARAPGSFMKSVMHQHTHLIKTEGIPRRLLFLIRKPYYFRYPF
jgi:diadenosine tetraphosphate (Ap4A) HIT family hydrolase